MTAVDLESIQALTRAAHAGQTDKLGRDYVAAHLTPIAAGLREFGPEAEAAGWLHDIIEDTHHTGASLRSAGISEGVVRAVESVTKAADEPYDELIDRACADPLGRVVKLVDNTWNLTCAPRLSESQPEVADDLARRKYRPARAKLLTALGWDESGPELVRLQRLLTDLERDPRVQLIPFPEARTTLFCQHVRRRVTEGVTMHVRVAAVVAVLIVAGACSDTSSSPEDSSTSSSPTASETTAGGTFDVAPGRIGPVEAGMTLEEAKKTGAVTDNPPDPDAPCPPPSLQWKAPNTDKLDLKDEDGKIVVLGVREPGFTTAEGVGVGSTLNQVEVAYPGSKVRESPASGSLVYLNDGNKWLAMAFGEQPEDLKQSSKINYMEVAVDERPVAYPDGC